MLLADCKASAKFGDRTGLSRSASERWGWEEGGRGREEHGRRSVIAEIAFAKVLARTHGEREQGRADVRG